MKRFLLSLILIFATLGAVAAPQDVRPPLSKDEVLDLLANSTPRKIIIGAIDESGIAFNPTPAILEEFRKHGADSTVLAALRRAWHGEIPKPLGDKEILMMLAEDEPSENIVRTVEERGIDFQPSSDYLDRLRSEGAKDALIDLLRATPPRPFSKAELLQLLATRIDQSWMAQRVEHRGVDFEPSGENLQALRLAGARPALLARVQTAKRAKPFVPVQPYVAPPLVEGKPATLICQPTDPYVPVLSEADDIGKIAVNLKCGEHVIFLQREATRPGLARIQYAGGQEGFVANAYLETVMATPGGDVTEPVKISAPNPPYTPEAGHKGIEGVVKLVLVIDAQGNVTSVQQTSEPLGSGLDQNAIDTVKTWKFHPSTRNGVPVAVRVRVEVSFRLYHRNN